MTKQSEAPEQWPENAWLTYGIATKHWGNQSARPQHEYIRRDIHEAALSKKVAECIAVTKEMDALRDSIGSCLVLSKTGSIVTIEYDTSDEANTAYDALEPLVCPLRPSERALVTAKEPSHE